jgi:hypothetical protein
MPRTAGTAFRTPAEIKRYLSGKSIKCLICGQRFQRLGTHLDAKHRTSVARAKKPVLWTGSPDAATRACAVREDAIHSEPRDHAVGFGEAFKRKVRTLSDKGLTDAAIARKFKVGRATVTYCAMAWRKAQKRNLTPRSGLYLWAGEVLGQGAQPGECGDATVWKWHLLRLTGRTPLRALMSARIPDDETGGAIRLMKKQTGSRWEITVDGKPRSYDHSKQMAIEGAQYLKLRNPSADVTVRDLEGVEDTIGIHRSGRTCGGATSCSRTPASSAAKGSWASG